jgi:hypothetical protein
MENEDAPMETPYPKSESEDKAAEEGEDEVVDVQIDEK